MKKLLAIMLSVGLLGSSVLVGAAQQPASPSGTGPPREQRGADEQPVLRHDSGSLEAPALQRHIENEGGLPPEMAEPRQRGSVDTANVPQQAPIGQANPSVASVPLLTWIIAGVVIAAIILAVGASYTRRPRRSSTSAPSDIDRDHSDHLDRAA